ncbi:(2Fe-2S)-binding protein [Pseudonocardia acaciae]|uniref:(2Fe-2S)-binding protein n=1 Tax=Pseudonocardia acaciae TaxID=551276 RepID=UPI000491DDA8|nr:(2Fe-2S)-binding protein [Pseudonocardia acaciae]
MPDVTIRLTVNGRPRTATVPARTSLADLLRDHLHLTGTHLGCEQGVCGACTVRLDELPVRACLTLAAACDGSEVVTVEGLDDPDADRLRACFSREGGLQCGFCTPGMLVSAHDLVRRRTVLDRDELCLALAGNVCRCTGYLGIVRAVGAAIAEGIEAEA